MTTVVRAEDFIASLGVDTHIPYTDGGYANIANVEADLAYLGITHVRDGISNGLSGSAPLSTYISLAEQGIKFTFCIAGGGAITTASMNATLALIAQLNTAVPGSVVAVEGVNEINNSLATFNGVGGLAGAVALQTALYAAVKSNQALAGVAVDYFTGYDAGAIATGPDPATTAGLANFDNQHPYPNNGQAPAAWVAPALALPNETAPYGPTVYTETGYSTNGVSQDVQAKYTLDLLMDDAANGIAQTDLYQLMDAYAPGSTQGDDGYGLFAPTTNAPKEAATAIHNLTTILSDSGGTGSTFTPKTLGYSVTGLPATGNSLLIDKSTGAQDVVVWNEPQIWNQATGTEIAVAATAVTVNLGGTFQTVKVFDPLISSSPIETLTGVSSVQLGLTDHPLIVEVEPVTTQQITGDVSANVLGENGVVLYNWNPTTQLANWIAAETAVANGTPGAQAKIIAFGDSTTAGVGAPDGQSYPDDLVAALAKDSGIPVQSVDLYGDQTDTSEISFVGGGTYNYGLDAAGAAMVQLAAPGQGVVWTPMGSGTFNRLDLSYWDNGNGSVTVTATGGPNGTFSQTVQFANSGNMMTQTIDLPEGSYSKITVVSNSATNASYIEGFGLWDSNTPAIQVINAGEGGAWASVVGNGQSTGIGEFPGGLALQPSLALIDYGLNDILNNTYTTAQTVANIALMITECRANNCDPIIVIPEPFSLDPTLANNLSSISALITALQALSIQMNVPIIDLNSTYGNSPTTYANDGLIGFGVHPGVAGYEDIAQRIAAVLTNASQSYSNTASYVVAGSNTVTGTSGNDVLFSAATSNTLVGDGGDDTYLMNPNDQTDTVVNGVSGATQPSGQLDVMAANREQLWFSKSGNNLVVQILGTAQQTIVQGWYASGGAQLQQIIAGDSYQISNAAIQSLVQAMAAFSAANPSFNPTTTSFTALTNSAFAGAVATAVAADWTTSTVTGASTPPAAPSAPALAAASDSGTVGDGITNVTLPTFTGTAPAGDTVKLYSGTTLIGSATASSAGAWSITATQALAAGSYTLFATATSAAGGVSADSPSFTLTIDTQAPAVPPAPVLAAASGDGIAGQTQSTTPTITGTAAAGATVSVYDGATLIGTTTATTSGTWSFTPSTALALGAHSLTATAADAAGNVSAHSAALALSVVAPVVTTSGSDTLVLSVADVAASGVNAQFTVSVNGTQVGGVQTATGAEASGGGQTITLTGNFGAAGPETVAVTFLNGFSGNAADAGRELFVNAVSLDNVAIFPNSQLLFDSTTSYSLTKPATTVASNAGTQDTLVLNLAETAVSGQNAMFMVSVDGQIVGGIQTVTASHAAGASQNVTLTGDFGSGSHTVAIDFLNGFGGNAADAGRNLFVNSITLDGNTTTENSDLMFLGATSYTVQAGTVTATPPAAPGALSLAAASDSGTVGDGITNVTMPTFVGTAPAGNTVKLYAGTTLIGSATASSAGAWTITATQALAAGTYTLFATDTSAAGLVSADSPTFALTISTQAPAAPSTPVLAAASDSGTVGDGITNVTLPSFVGTAPAGDTVKLYSGTTLIGTGTASSAGAWTITATQALAAGSYTLFATATNVAGSVSADSPSFALTISTQAPAAPSTPVLAAASDSGTVGDGITNVTLPSFVGTAPAGDTVKLYSGTTLIGTGTASSAGAWSITAAQALAAGSYTLFATATNVAGSVSADSPTFALTISTQAPAAPGALSLSAASDSGTVGDGITNVTLPSFVGTAPAGDTVKLYSGTTLIGSATASSAGAWTITATQALVAGSYTLFATATNVAGSVSANSASFALTIDTQAPAVPPAPVLAAASGDGIAGQTQSTTPTITGTAAAGATVSVYDGATLIGTTTATTSGTWSFTPSTALALGAHSLTATAADAAGNVSAHSAALALSVVAPVVTTSSSDTLVLSVADVAASGVNAQFTVSVNGTQVGGVQTVTAAEAAGGGQTITLTGNFGAAGPETVAVTFLNGFTGNAADAGRELFVNAVSLDGQAIMPDSRLLFDSTTSYALTKPATPVASNAGTQDTLVLNLAETAVSGANALFMVSVDGQIVGGIQTVTASHAAGASQNVTLTGDFGSGSHTVAIDFLNGFGGSAADAGRNLFVNSITLDGNTTTENSDLMFLGATSYTVQAGTVQSAVVKLALVQAAVLQADPPAPPSAPSLAAASDSGTAGDGITNDTLPTFVGTAPAGDTVQLYAGTALIGSAAAADDGTWSITAAQALAAGGYTLFATATDADGNVSADSSSFALTIDTQTPDTPSTPVLAASSGDGNPDETQSTTPTITGTADAGDTVSVYDGTTVIGATTATTAGTWSFTPGTALALGVHDLTATATDVAGNVSAASGTLAVSVVDPPPPPSTLVLNVAEFPASGVDAQFTVSVDGTQVGGVQTTSAAEAAGGGQNITLTGDFGTAGPHDVTVTYLNGFTGGAVDAGRMLFINAISLGGLTVFPDSTMLFDTSNSYTVQQPATPVVSNAGTQDTLVLNLSETAVGGQDALFMVSVDGQLVGGIESVTASEAAGQSQNVALTGDFGSGPHTVAINFLNGFSGNDADAGRTLFVNAISLNGHTTTENASQFYFGAASYTI